LNKRNKIVNRAKLTHNTHPDFIIPNPTLDVMDQ